MKANKYSGSASDQSAPDTLAYTPADRREFEALMKFTGHGERMAGSTDDIANLYEAGAVAYTHSDLLEFAKLNNFGDNPGGRQYAGSRSRPAAAGQYDEDDYRLFDELTDFDRPFAPGWSRDIARPSAPVASPVVYTNQDLDGFSILGDAVADVDPGYQLDDDAIVPVASADRDVGHIRIVDTDKLRAAEKTSRVRGKTDMKIRFFD